MCLRHGFLEGRRPNRALERLVERATHSSEEWRWVRLPGGAVCVILMSSRLVPRGLAGLPGGGVCIALTASILRSRRHSLRRGVWVVCRVAASVLRSRRQGLCRGVWVVCRAGPSVLSRCCRSRSGPWTLLMVARLEKHRSNECLREFWEAWTVWPSADSRTSKEPRCLVLRSTAHQGSLGCMERRAAS